MPDVSLTGPSSVLRRAAISVAVVMLAAGATVSTQAPAAAPGAHRLTETYGWLPLHFEPNAGQADARTDFLARGKGYNLFLTRRGAVLGLRTGDGARSTVLSVTLAGANTGARATGSDTLPGRVHYFIGDDPTKWRTNLPTYGRVHYEAVYPGIDLAYYGNQGQLEYDFIVAPGADLTQIAMSFEGVQSMALDRNGDLVLHTAGGEVRQHKPVVYQEVAGSRQAVAGRYVMKSGRRVGFEVGAYDEHLPLVIDPVLVYSTYLGGSLADQGNAIAVDAAGNAYVTGVTSSADFPTPTGYDTLSNGGTDAFVSKLSADGLTVMYSTYLGGGQNDDGRGIAVDAVGNAYVTGVARNGFPTTPGAYDTTIGGVVTMDVFVAKLDAAGELVYSTFVGGASNDEGRAIAVDGSGSAYVTGLANAGFPTTPGVVDTTASGTEVFVTKLNTTGTGPLLYSTFLGGLGNDDGRGIAVDAAGNAYVTGVAASAFPWTPGAYDTTFGGGISDAFVTRLNTTATALLYSTFLGGPGNDDGRGIAVDAAGDAYVTGSTDSDLATTTGAFDTTRGGRDAYVAKFDATGTTALYLTYVGGDSTDDGRDITVDAAGTVHLTGQTASTPSGPFQPTPGASDSTPGGATDAFITTLVLGSSGAQDLVYSTYLGGGADEAGNGIAVDADGNAYITGVTSSADFPGLPVPGFDITHNGGNDAFVTKLSARVITLTLDPPSATLDLGAEHQLVVTAHDEHNNPAVGVKVPFSVNGTPSGFITTDNNGQGIFEYSGPPTPGTDTITAYPDANNDGEPDAFEVSASATAAFWDQTTTAVVSSDNPSSAGQLVTFIATVTASSVVDQGTVTFLDGVTPISPPVPVDEVNGTGQARFETSILSVGTHTINTEYSSDGNFRTSTGSVDQTVNKASSTTTVTSSVNPSVFEQSVTFTATVSAVAPGAGTPSGSVQFLDNGTPIGAPVAVSGGVATMNTSALTIGSHTITTQYLGDGNFDGSAGTATQTVDRAARPVLRLTKSVDKATANPGDTLVYTLTYANRSTGAASGVTIRDVVPANTTFVSASGGTNSAGTVAWAIGNLAAGASGSVRLTVRISPDLSCRDGRGGHKHGDDGCTIALSNRGTITSTQHPVPKPSRTVTTRVKIRPDDRPERAREQTLNGGNILR